MDKSFEPKGAWDDYFELRGMIPGGGEASTVPPAIKDLLPQDKSSEICDIGCGHGLTLAAIARLGYPNAFGIEPSASACTYARSRGLKVHYGTVNELAASLGNRVQFAYMSHVLEHIPKQDVIPTLKLIKEALLAPNGRLLVIVPNAQSFTGAYWRYEDWTHETLFTGGSLLHVMRAAGFQNAAIHDPDCMMQTRPAFRPFRRLLLAAYRCNYRFWIRVTCSAVHRPSPLVFSFEVKAIG